MTRARHGARALGALLTLASVSLASLGTLALGEGTAWAQKGGAHEEISLAVGETKTLSAAGVKEYSEGVKGVVDVVPTPDGRTFVVTGKKPGTTTLLLIKNDGAQTTYDISVANRNPQQVEREIQQLLEPFPGVKSRRVGSRIFLEGAVPTDQDFRRIQQIVTVYGGQVDSLVTVGVAERKLLIRLDFFFVQYSKTSGYNVGVGWPGNVLGTSTTGQPVVTNNITADFISRTTTTANASVVNQPLPRLDIAARHGWAKVLKQSSVITANGNEATFQNGGETNFLLTGIGAASLVSVKFGTNVTVLPRYDSNSRDVEIKLSADVADLTAPSSANGPPGRLTTKLDTQVTLKLGQALILSGIKTSSQQRNVAGLPGLSEIPVLGLLFGTHAQEKQDTEGAVFIVPSVVDTVPKSALELINNALGTYKEYTGDIEYLETYPKTPPSAK
ncbi:MAG TPA: pilus assembly protein N-terminal domain-containing protein [Labilithrix sp.]|nr:pilus assembly protein N-terminal domain-containing protein [Labilithrix sp.]